MHSLCWHILYALYWTCKIIEVVVPELLEMRTAHLVSIGSEFLASVNPDCEDGYVTLAFWNWRWKIYHISSILRQSGTLLGFCPWKEVPKFERILIKEIEIFRTMNFKLLFLNEKEFKFQKIWFPFRKSLIFRQGSYFGDYLGNMYA